MATLLCSLFIFGMFRLIVRQPLFWFAIALCLVADAGARRAATERAVGPNNRLLGIAGTPLTAKGPQPMSGRR